MSTIARVAAPGAQAQSIRSNTAAGKAMIPALPARVQRTSALRVVSEADAATSAPPKRKPSPLSQGGTLSGSKAAGKDAGAAALAALQGQEQAGSLEFTDSRWVGGTWDLAQFSDSNGEVDWDLVIDAEMARRRILEDNPEPLLDSSSKDLVTFDTGIIPWWAWVRRFHLPEAEKLNGRAAMVGYAAGYLVDALTGQGLVDQQSSFIGKTLIFATILGTLFIRKTEDIDNLKGLADEATFYDSQWQATWDGAERPSETEK